MRILALRTRPELLELRHETKLFQLSSVFHAECLPSINAGLELAIAQSHAFFSVLFPLGFPPALRDELAHVEVEFVGAMT